MSRLTVLLLLQLISIGTISAFQISSPQSTTPWKKYIQRQVVPFHEISSSYSKGATPCKNGKSASPLRLEATKAPSPSGGMIVIDYEAITKYGIAAITQLSVLSALFAGLDQILSLTEMSVLPSPITWILCYALSLKSRVFNPLNNSRPNLKKTEGEGEEGGSAGFNDRIQPSWTPPGFIFPIVWILIVSPLRATSSTILINSLGGYFTLPLMSLMLHLTCGDVWNTINNTEKRYGTSVLGISFVYFSALHAAWRYYEANAFAGELLAATAIWLTIASSLIIQTWRLNVNDDGEKESILPVKVDGEESKTQFSWF
mmetsp:Transcript_8707/g.10984  ORF Transcript_8707/g.10984 Transcript_8707/m.10984 type:complete len:315 (-) Transcript_8707:87-1031(-)